MEKEQTTVMLGAQKVLAQVRKAVVGKEEVLLWTQADPQTVSQPRVLRK